MHEVRRLKEKMREELKGLEKLQRRIEKSLSKAPEGALVLSVSNGVTQYHHKTHSKEKKGKYLNKAHKKLIHALAQKDYDKQVLKEIEKRIKRLSRIIEWLPEKGLEQIYENLSEARKELVLPYVLPDEQYIEQWQKVEYSGRPFTEISVSFLTERGEKVRSKSEKIIADKLYSMGIPYRYEYPLELKGERIIYPDFTLLDVKNRREIYLEHLGMMDYAEYCDKAIMKIQSMARHGIFSGKNLLLTFETSQNPLNIVYLEELLNEYFT